MSSPKSSSTVEESNEGGGSVSKMLSSFQSSENRAVESAVPQVALQAFAFLSENTAAQVYPNVFALCYIYISDCFVYG